MKLEFSLRVFEKYLSKKFHENPCSGNRVVHVDGQTDMKTNIKKSMKFSRAESRVRCDGLPTFHELRPHLQGVLVVW
jgi:hypothetical protein